MNKRLFIIFLFCASCLYSQQAKKYPTLLWKISGNNMKKESYLYGTMHVSNRVAYHLSDQFFDAIKSSDVVGLETNPASWLSNMELIGELSRNSGASLYNPYGSNFYKSVFGIRFPDKQVYQTILRFDPEIINGLLYRSSTSKENFEENTYIDMFIFQAASKLNKQVISLEDFRQSEIQAKLAAIPDSELNGEEEKQEDYSGFNRTSIAEQIEDAYRQGNLNAIDSLTQLIETKNMQKYLLHNRNVFFVHTIDSVLKSGKTLFSGVGAAHLPGEKGVIELLRLMNYKVEPVFPKQSKKAIKEKETFDKQFKPINFEKQYAIDSLFSLQLPGKLTQIMNFDNIKYFINADMINGNFYTVARLKTNAILNDFSVDKMILKIDSLLYENIPGKIITKKEINNNGFKGFDLTARTSRGHLQRYQLYVTNIELILFKLGGKADYVNTNAGKQFFNSIKFESKVLNKTVFEPKTKGFKATIPNEYDYSRNDYVGVSGLVEDLSAFDKNNTMFYGVKHAIYNDFYYIEEDSFELNRLAAYTLANFKFKNDIRTELKVEQKVPCIYFNATNDSKNKFFGKIYIKGIHYYLAFVIGDNKNEFDQPFFKSFSLTDFAYVNEIVEITDSELSFKTRDETSDTPIGRFNSDLSKAYKHIKDSVSVNKTKLAEFDYVSRVKNYYSPSSHEYIEINYERYNDYDYRDKQKLFENLNKNLGEFQTMNVRSIKNTDSSGVWLYELMLTDTASVRAIKVKVLAQHGTVYQIKIPVDTVLGLSGWAKEFYESFKLKDTVIGKNIFVSKFKQLLNDLLSTDTVVKRQANTSLLNSISMDKSYLNDFIDFMGSEKVSGLSSNAKAQLFVNGGVLESDKIIDTYSKLYNQYEDSAYLQICLLKGLAYCKSKNSYNAILKLLLKETPLVGDAEIVTDVFKVMQDSLVLCKDLFPGILPLTKFAEYHEPIYKLLSLLVKNKMLTTQVLNNFKNAIIADANSELKRFNAALSGKSKTANINSYGANKDYAIEEAIDLIKANMTAMTNNQFIKNNLLKDRLSVAKQPLIVCFAQITALFYKSDENAKQFITKVSKLKNEQIAMPVFLILKKFNITLNDTLATYYSKNIYTRAYFYSELESEKMIEVFDKAYLSQASIVESVIKSYGKLSAYDNYEQENTKDSLIFYKKLKAKNKYENGELYIYKTTKNKFGIAKWSVAYVPSISKQKITSDIITVKLNEIYNETKSELEIENEIVDDFANTYRSRILPSAGISYDY